MQRLDFLGNFTTAPYILADNWNKRRIHTGGAIPENCSPIYIHARLSSREDRP